MHHVPPSYFGKERSIEFEDLENGMRGRSGIVVANDWHLIYYKRWGAGKCWNSKVFRISERSHVCRKNVGWKKNDSGGVVCIML